MVSSNNYTPADYRDIDDVYGQDWSLDMTRRHDSVAVAVATIVERDDGVAITGADCVVDHFQVVIGSNAMQTAFRVTQSGQIGVLYRVTLEILTNNGVTLFRSVPLPVTKR